MQISKCLLVVCALTCAGTVRAADNEAQAKAREALQKKLQEMGAQPAPAAQAAPAEPAVKVIPAPATPTPAPAPAAAQAAPGRYGADPASIEKAREAMRQKMQEVVAQEPAAVAPPAAVPAAPAPAAVPVAPPPAAPAVAVPAAQAAPAAAVVPPPADNETIAKARQALDQKMKELRAQPTEAPAIKPAPVIAAPSKPVQPTVVPPPTVTPPPPVQVAAPPPAQVPPPVQSQSVQLEAATTPPPATAPFPMLAPQQDTEEIIRARAALHAKMQELGTQPAVAPSSKAPRQPALAVEPSGTKPTQVAVVREDKPPKAPKPPKAAPLTFPAMEAPPLPISMDKKQQLDALLERYKADQITPDQYQAERAKILGSQ